MPWRMPAARMASSGFAEKARPLGCTVMVNVIFSVSLGKYFFPEPLILPSNQNPLGALPARFRRERVLIVGCGDVGLRVAKLVRNRVRVLALTSTSERVDVLR